MARSATTGFYFRKSLLGVEHPSPQRFKVANSTTLKEGDAVRINTSGFVVRTSASLPVGGIVVGLINQDGINPFSLGADAAGSTLIPGDSLTTGSTNQTAATFIQAEVLLDPSGQNLYFNIASAALTVANLFSLFNTVSAAPNQIDQATASATTGQFQLISLDPDGDGVTTKGLFRIALGQLAVGVDQGNAKVSA